MQRLTVLRIVQGLALLALIPAFLTAGPNDKEPPRANYKLSSKYSLTNITPRSPSTMVQPTFIGKTDEFWYSYRTSQNKMYWRVDPAKKTKTALFDREKLAEKLAALSRKPVDGNTLQISREKLGDDGAKFSFVYSEFLYEYDIKNDNLASKGKAPPPQQFPGQGTGGGFGRGRRSGSDADFDFDHIEIDEPQQEDKTKQGQAGDKDKTPRAFAPDKKGILFAKDHELYLGEVGKEKEAVKLSKGGMEDYGFRLLGGFGGGGGGFGQQQQPRGITPLRSSMWSPDSKHYYAMRADSRNVKELFVINSLATPRPTLEKYKYPMPGEEAIAKGELHVGSRESKTLAQVQPKWRDESYSKMHWGKDNELRFIRQDRLHRNIELCAVDTVTGQCRTLISEGFENAPIDPVTPIYLEASNEMIWWSERSGWGHYYLYDRDGKLKNAITSGQWRASQIVALDEKNRVLYFAGNAREKGENVYYRHLYSVKFDGTGLTLLDPGDNYHFSTLSPTNKFVVDNCMRIDRCPETVLRDDKGNQVMELEKCDLSRLKEYGWSPPETFMVKAADGVTDLYGNMWKPFDFDPKKKYPIIAHVYPGPQQEGLSHTFSTYTSEMRLAQLGFIVIQVGHRGGSPQRSKAYGSYGYFNLRDYGLEDKKHAIEQLALKYAFIDVTKVGIYGHSGGGFMSAAAMLQKPYNEFFKAAVASAGNHDNNIYNNFWSEHYHGLKEVPVGTEEKKDKSTEAKQDKTKQPQRLEPAAPPTTEAKKEEKKETPAAPPTPKTKFEIKVPTNSELAANLKGRLMLVHGELDNNVHPANTMRLVDALIKANKRFDMLMLPGQRHGFGTYTPYFQRRMEEFFAESLLGDRREGVDMDER